MEEEIPPIRSIIEDTVPRKTPYNMQQVGLEPFIIFMRKFCGYRVIQRSIISLQLSKYLAN